MDHIYSIGSPAAAPPSGPAYLLAYHTANYTSGQYLVNEGTLGSDGDHDLCFGATTSSSTDDPTITGSPQYGLFDGTDFFTQIGSMIPFIRDLVKNGNGFCALRFYKTDTTGVMGLVGATPGSGGDGWGILINGSTLNLDRKIGGTIVRASSIKSFSASTWSTLVVTWEFGGSGAWKAILNDDTPASGTLFTLSDTTTEVDYKLSLGGWQEGSQVRVENNTRISDLVMGANFLSDSEMSDLHDYIAAVNA